MDIDRQIGYGDGSQSVQTEPQKQVLDFWYEGTIDLSAPADTHRERGTLTIAAQTGELPPLNVSFERAPLSGDKWPVVKTEDAVDLSKETGEKAQEQLTTSLLSLFMRFLPLTTP